jgi:hypothetical protein
LFYPQLLSNLRQEKLEQQYKMLMLKNVRVLLAQGSIRNARKSKRFKEP